MDDRSIASATAPLALRPGLDAGPAPTVRERRARTGLTAAGALLGVAVLVNVVVLVAPAPLGTASAPDRDAAQPTPVGAVAACAGLSGLGGGLILGGAAPPPACPAVR